MALLSTGFGKSLIYQLLPIVSEKLGRPKVIIVIVSPLVALMDDQVKEAAKHSLGCTMIQKSWRGISALYLASPYPGFSIQNGELCWHQPYTKTTSSSTKHTSHTNGEFDYSFQLVHLFQHRLSSRRLTRRITYAIIKTLCDWLTGTPMILNFRQAPPARESKRLSIIPFLCPRIKAK